MQQMHGCRCTSRSSRLEAGILHAVFLQRLSKMEILALPAVPSQDDYIMILMKGKCARFQFKGTWSWSWVLSSSLAHHEILAGKRHCQILLRWNTWTLHYASSTDACSLAWAWVLRYFNKFVSGSRGKGFVNYTILCYNRNFCSN